MEDKIPQDPGLYVRLDDDLADWRTPIFFQDRQGLWAVTDPITYSGNDWQEIHRMDVPLDLVRLVKESE